MAHILMSTGFLMLLIVACASLWRDLAAMLRPAPRLRADDYDYAAPAFGAGSAPLVLRDHAVRRRAIQLARRRAAPVRSTPQRAAA
jgi:hypothetical protein